MQSKLIRVEPALGPVADTRSTFCPCVDHRVLVAGICYPCVSDVVCEARLGGRRRCSQVRPAGELEQFLAVRELQHVASARHHVAIRAVIGSRAACRWPRVEPVDLQIGLNHVEWVWQPLVRCRLEVRQRNIHGSRDSHARGGLRRAKRTPGHGCLRSARVGRGKLEGLREPISTRKNVNHHRGRCRNGTRATTRTSSPTCADRVTCVSQGLPRIGLGPSAAVVASLARDVESLERRCGRLPSVCRRGVYVPLPADEAGQRHADVVDVERLVRVFRRGGHHGRHRPEHRCPAHLLLRHTEVLVVLLSFPDQLAARNKRGALMSLRRRAFGCVETQ